MALTKTHVCSWGIDHGRYTAAAFFAGASGTKAGILYGVDVSVDPVLAPEHNEIGQVISQTQYDAHGRCTGTLQVAHGIALPSSSEVIQVDDKYYYLVSATLSESNQSYDKYNVTLERYHLTGAGFVVGATGWSAAGS